MMKRTKLLLLALYVATLEAIIPHERFEPEYHDSLDDMPGVWNGVEDNPMNLYKPSEDFNRLDPTRPKRRPVTSGGRPVVLTPRVAAPKVPKKVAGPKVPPKMHKKILKRPQGLKKAKDQKG